jgi:hypothetical protein
LEIYNNDLTKVLEYLNSIFSVKAQEKNLRLDFNVDKGIPEGMLLGDSHRLTQASTFHLYAHVR